MASPAIDVTDLRKQYGDVEALRGVDCEVERGSFFGLLGPNGAGKTTFINILLNLVAKTSGGAEVFGYDVETDYQEVHDLVGIAPQEVDVDVFFPIREVLVHKAGYHGYSLSEARERADKMLHTFGIYDKRDAKVYQLSGGMKRRLLLARALLTEPELLILDEPTAGVDVELRHDLWDLMRSFNEQGRTILLTTHYIEEAEQLCDEVAIMNKGKILDVDTPSNFIGRGMDTMTIELDNAASVDLDIDGSYRIEGSTLHVETRDGARVLTGVLHQLESQGHDVVEVHTERSKLEDIFVHLTGDDDA